MQQTPRKSRKAKPRLSAAMLFEAYRAGAFPMADPRTRRIEWFAADPRSIIELDSFHVPRSLAREVRKRRFDIRFDTAFEQVIRACAEDRSEDNRCWISEEMIAAYTELHRQGHAHTVEAWLEGGGSGEVKLVGGLYGVHIGAAFFGESMFSRPRLGGSNSSKVCLVHLVERLGRGGFRLLDTQFSNPHMSQFRPVEVSNEDYMGRLKVALESPARWD